MIESKASTLDSSDNKQVYICKNTENRSVKFNTVDLILNNCFVFCFPDDFMVGYLIYSHKYSDQRRHFFIMVSSVVLRSVSMTRHFCQFLDPGKICSAVHNVRGKDWVFFCLCTPPPQWIANQGIKMQFKCRLSALILRVIKDFV